MIEIAAHGIQHRRHALGVDSREQEIILRAHCLERGGLAPVEASGNGSAVGIEGCHASSIARSILGHVLRQRLTDVRVLASKAVNRRFADGGVHVHGVERHTVDDRRGRQGTIEDRRHFPAWLPPARSQGP